MCIGHRGGFGAARVDDDELATTRLHGLGLAFEIGHSPHAAVAGQWVGANHQQQFGARNVGQGDGEPVAKHQTAGELFGHLVQGRSGEYVLGAQGTRQLAKVAEQPDLVCRWIAHHHGAGVFSVGRQQGWQAALNFGKGFFPRSLYKSAIALDQRGAQAVRVFVQIFQGDALGAEVACAEHVLRVAFDAADLAALHFDFQPAAGLAQGADTVVNGLKHGWPREDKLR